MAARSVKTRRLDRGSGDDPGLDELLVRCLAEKELVQVAAAALRALGREGLERLRPLLPADTFRTLQRLGDLGPVAPAAGPASIKATPGSARVQQDWARLQERWDACVAETTDEKGDYIGQEHHWESPYFDVDRFAADLDRIAGEMEPLIPLVIDYGLESDFSFFERLEDAALEVGTGLPEWMENQGGTGLAGPVLSRCVLQWERHTGRHAGEGAEDAAAFAFLDRVRLAEEEASDWGLCYGAVPGFVAGLGSEEQRGILAGFSAHRHEPHWERVLASPDSGWFQTLEQLLARFAPAEHTELLRKSVSGDWRLALPVLEEASAGGSDWEETIASAVPGLVGSRDGSPWDHGRTLLIIRKAREWHPEAEAKKVGRFLELWEGLLRGDGRPAEAAVLGIQRVVWEAWGDWERILEEFGLAATIPGSADTGLLFEQWRQWVTERSRPDAGFRTSPAVMATSWVPLLVDAARFCPDDQAAFQAALRGWLGLAGEGAEGFRSARPWLELLTADLAADLRLAAEAPFLHRALGQLRQDSELARSRRTWLRRLGAANLEAEIMKAWRADHAQLLPDPGRSTGSRYEDHARWLGVVFDLDPASFRRTIRSWRQDHARRRNLWEAIRAIGLPLDG